MPEQIFERFLFILAEFKRPTVSAIVQQAFDPLAPGTCNPTAHRIAMDAKNLNQRLDLKTTAAN